LYNKYINKDELNHARFSQQITWHLTGSLWNFDPEFALPPENVPRELKECDEEKHAESLKKKSQIFTVSMNPRRHVTIYDNAAKI